MAVGIVYDPIYLEHGVRGHVENATRLIEVMSMIDKSGLREQVACLSPRKASIDEIARVHTLEYIHYIETVSNAGIASQWLDADTAVSSSSYQAALFAAGGVITGVDCVLQNKLDSVFALVRPPGHHAVHDRAMGFCLFNNIAIAAKYAIETYGVKRILIADFDVHHGNGTQEAFYNNPNVVYFSVHQHPLYPGTGYFDECGEGAGQGHIINVPLPPGCGDIEYMHVFNSILTPAAQRFQPQLILISAGYDAHWIDPISTMQLSITAFARMVLRLKYLAQQYCNGHTVLTLEGGYNPQILSYAVKATLEILLGKIDIEDPFGPSPTKIGEKDISDVLNKVKELHSL
jgi:acetoin utilization deacetylase AcuC-like enzyme